MQDRAKHTPDRGRPATAPAQTKTKSISVAEILDSPKADLKVEKIVSAKHGFLWAAVPKAGTRSMIALLKKQPGEPIESRQLTARLWALLQAQPTLRDLYTFAFVRNPWSRIVSTYENKICLDKYNIQETNVKPYEGLYYRMPFAEFVHWLAEAEAGQDQYANRHWISQYLFLCDPNGTLIPNFVGKLENFTDDVTALFRRLHLPLPEVLPWQNNRFEDNKNPGRVAGKYDPHYYRSYYDEDLKRLVGMRYGEDIERFKYLF